MPTSTRAADAFGFTKHCSKNWRTQRADRVVRPYRTLCGVADGVCRFANAICRGERGIDPNRHITRSPIVVRICWCVLRGRGKPLPYANLTDSARSPTRRAPLPLPLGEVSEHSEDGEGQQLPYRPSQSASLTSLPKGEPRGFRRSAHIAKTGRAHPSRSFFIRSPVPARQTPAWRKTRRG